MDLLLILPRSTPNFFLSAGLPRAGDLAALHFLKGHDAFFAFYPTFFFLSFNRLTFSLFARRLSPTPFWAATN